MNAIGMLVQPTQVEVVQKATKTGAKSEDGTSLFSMLIKQQGKEESLHNLTEPEATMGEMNLAQLLEVLAKMKVDISSLLENGQLGNSETLLNQYLTEQLSMNGLQANSFLTTETVDQSLLSEIVDSNFLTDIVGQSMDIQGKTLVELSQTELAKLQEQLGAILTKFESLLSEVSGQQDIKKIAPQILELLKQWTGIETKLVHLLGKPENGLESMNLKVNVAWKEILLAYQNRSKLTSKQVYQSDSQVTTKDVVKWLENALQNQQASQVQNFGFHSNMAMSKLEQYVIFVNQNQSGQTVNQQLIDQFQQVMNTSKFSSTPNGVNQLSIAFRPENLGEMMVRLTQINGEMTVRIVVTTQAAKEMLESNIHQLKHMFSPQQVVIERQDMNAGQAQNQTKESNEDSFKNSQSQSGQSDQSEHQDNHGEEDFETQLKEMIYQEKA